MSTIKKDLANKLLKITTGLSKSSTVMTPLAFWNEPKLPKSLLKK